MPGPDIIPNKALKVVAKTRSDIFVELLEVGLVNGTFPEVWKYQKLMFLSKKVDDNWFTQLFSSTC